MGCFVKVKAGNLFEAMGVLRGAINDRRDDRFHLPTVAAFRVSLLIRQLDPAFIAMQESRIALLKRFGAEKRPGYWEVTPENNEEFHAHWKAIIDEELEIKYQPIQLESLGDGLSYFSVSELVLLGDFVKEN